MLSQYLLMFKMSFFRSKRRKIGYEAIQSEKKLDNNEIVIGEGVSLEAVNLLINNFVDTRDDGLTNVRRLNYGGNLMYNISNI